MTKKKEQDKLMLALMPVKKRVKHPVAIITLTKLGMEYRVNPSFKQSDEVMLMLDKIREEGLVDWLPSYRKVKVNINNAGLLVEFFRVGGKYQLIKLEEGV